MRSEVLRSIEIETGMRTDEKNETRKERGPSFYDPTTPQPKHDAYNPSSHLLRSLRVERPHPHLHRPSSCLRWARDCDCHYDSPRQQFAPPHGPARGRDEVDCCSEREA